MACPEDENFKCSVFLSQQTEPNGGQREHHREIDHLMLDLLCPVWSSACGIYPALCLLAAQLWLTQLSLPKLTKRRGNCAFCSNNIEEKPSCQGRGPGSSPQHECPAEPTCSDASQTSRRAECKHFIQVATSAECCR